MVTKIHVRRLLSEPFQKDDSRRRLEWMAHMEFAGGGDGRGDLGKGKKAPSPSASDGRKGGALAWDTMVQSITRTDKLR